MGKLRFIEYENIYVERLIFFVDLSIFFDNYFWMREWLSGRALPCQGKCREFESRFPLHFFCIKFGTIAKR